MSYIFTDNTDTDTDTDTQTQTQTQTPALTRMLRRLLLGRLGVETEFPYMFGGL